MFNILNLKFLIEQDIDEYIDYMSTIFKIFLGILVVMVTVSVFAFVSGWFIFDKIIERDSLNILLQILKIIFEIYVLGSLMILIIQSCLSRKHKQTSINLEKSHKAIDMLYKWSSESTVEMYLARKIVDKMKDEEIKKLVDGEKRISIPKDYHDMIKDFFPKGMELSPKESKQKDDKHDEFGGNGYDNSKCEFTNRCETANSVELTLAQTIWLRSWVVKYLNLLETIMYAWQSGVIDKEIIEKEFEYLVKTERDGSVVLERYRKFSGQENYPGIYSFCKNMEERKRKEIERIKLEG